MEFELLELKYKKRIKQKVGGKNGLQMFWGPHIAQNLNFVGHSVSCTLISKNKKNS